MTKRFDANKLVRMDSKDAVQKAQQEMQHLKRHFLVVVFRALEEPPKKDGDPIISSDLTDSRQTILGEREIPRPCRWAVYGPDMQFGPLSRQYMLLYYTSMNQECTPRSSVRRSMSDGPLAILFSSPCSVQHTNDTEPYSQ